MPVDNNRVTQSVIVGTATLVAAVSWATLERLFFGGGFWLWPVLSLLALTVFLSLIWMLTSSRAVLYVTLFFVLVTFFFNFGFRWQYLISMVLAGACFALGSYLAVKEGKMRLKIQVVPILRRGLPMIFTGLSLLIASAYYFSPMALQEGQEIKIPKPLFETVSTPLVSTLESQGWGIGGEKIETPKDGEVSISNEQIKQKLYLTSNGYLNRLKEMYEQYIPLGLAVGFFLALKALSVIFMWLTILISFLIFRFLVWRGAITIQEQTALKEVIEV